jgi:hypothetical protein
MTPATLIDLAKARYNSTGDNFFTQAEMLALIWAAEKEMAVETNCIESTGTANTVASQRAYGKPTDCTSLFRIEHDGVKLKPYSFRDDDLVTLNDALTTTVGTPAYYAEWGENIYLRPVPEGIKALTYYFYKSPSVVTIGDSTLEVPEPFHLSILYYLVREMAIKDSNPGIANYYGSYWEREIARLKKYMKKRRRGDAPAIVQDVDALPNTLLGWA